MSLKKQAIYTATYCAMCIGIFFAGGGANLFK